MEKWTAFLNHDMLNSNPVMLMTKLFITEKPFITLMPEQLNPGGSPILHASKTLSSLQYLTISYSFIVP